MKQSPLIYLLIFLYSGIALSADPIVLFTPTNKYKSKFETVPDYNNIVKKLKPGDRVQFSDGSVWTLQNHVGGESTSRIFTIKEEPNLVLRIPAQRSALSDSQSYVDGYKILQPYGAPVIKMDPRSSAEHTFMEKSQINGRTLEDLFRGKIKDAKLQAEMKAGLAQFAREIAIFEQIGDLYPRHIFFDPKLKKWLIFDWDDNNFIALEKPRGRAPSFTSKTALELLFSEYFYFNEEPPGLIRPRKDKWILELYKSMHASILEEREQILKRPNLIRKNRLNEATLHARSDSSCDKKFSHLAPTRK